MRTPALLLLLLTASALAEVHPNPLFTDHAVLQSGMAVPVWGTADPGEKVTVSIAGQTKSAITAPDGKWTLKLAALKPGGPVEMTIAGKNTLTVKDILIGEVWLGSGQSNMVFTLSAAHNPWAGILDEAKEIAAADFPHIRIFTAKATKTYDPQATVEGEWLLVTPANAPDFSAIGYLFARDLQKALNVPVGILSVAYGASTAESWLPRATVAADSLLKPMLESFDARVAFFREHPGASDDQAPGAPQTLNARPAKPAPLKDPVQDQHQPTVLFNGMLNPVIPYAIRGALWYQGESIVGGKKGVALYPHVMETLVTDWRTRWGEGNFPFYAVQLAALRNSSNNPAVREAQAQILKLPNTALAVTIDIGDPANVHPKNKEPLGQRLTDIALANTYGKKLEFSGPVYASMQVEGPAIRVTFTHAQGLKAAPTPNQLIGLPLPAAPKGEVAPLAVPSTPDPKVLADAATLHWFQIAGPDLHFVDATAFISGSTVLVQSPAVPNPVAVRYAWDNYPDTANLYNAANLPAAPFRTDTADALTPIAKEFTGN